MCCAPKTRPAELWVVVQLCVSGCEEPSVQCMNRPHIHGNQSRLAGWPLTHLLPPSCSTLVCLDLQLHCSASSLFPWGWEALLPFRGFLRLSAWAYLRISLSCPYNFLSLNAFFSFPPCRFFGQLLTLLPPSLPCHSNGFQAFYQSYRIIPSTIGLNVKLY